jgi:hypothetical protein
MFTTSRVTIGTGSTGVSDALRSGKEPAVQPTQFDEQRDDSIQKWGTIHPTKIQPGPEDDEQSRSLKSCESLLDSVVMHIRRTSSTLP